MGAGVEFIAENGEAAGGEAEEMTGPPSLTVDSFSRAEPAISAVSPRTGEPRPSRGRMAHQTQ
jgi:hypothetical protein